MCRAKSKGETLARLFWGRYRRKVNQSLKTRKSVSRVPQIRRFNYPCRFRCFHTKTWLSRTTWQVRCCAVGHPTRGMSQYWPCRGGGGQGRMSDSSTPSALISWIFAVMEDGGGIDCRSFPYCKDMNGCNFRFDTSILLGIIWHIAWSTLGTWEEYTFSKSTRSACLFIANTDRTQSRSRESERD
jgi:hypothetical protein